MALKYTTVERIFDVEPMIGSLTDLSSGQIVTAFAEPAESQIDAAIVRNYDLPISGTVPLLQAIADDISIYRILSRRVLTSQQLKDSAWPDKFREAMEDLARISKGDVLLVDDTGNELTTRADLAQVSSNTKNYNPTFHEGSELDWVRDPNKIDDILSDRDLD